MAEINEDPCRINRNLYTNKRKSEEEISDLPVPKHVCLEKSSTPETCFLSNIQSDIEDLRNSRKEMSNNNSYSRYDHIDEVSAKDSNSCSEDVDSVMSVSNDSKSDQHSNSSVNWGGEFFDSSVNSVDRLEAKIGDAVSTDPAYNLFVSPSFEEQEMDCGGEVSEFSISEYENGGIKKLEEEALEDLFRSSGVVSNNFVLSSGRWNVNEDGQHGSEKLTIDKEFEQYFSMLML